MATRAIPFLMMWFLVTGCVQNGLMDEPDSITVVINELSPNIVETFGGESVLIIGKNFNRGAIVLVDGSEIESSRLSSTAINFTAPQHDRGLVDIEIRLPDGRSNLCQECLEYLQPRMRIDSVQPDRGPTSGGTEVLIRGVNFPAELLVLFGESEGVAKLVERERIIAISPPHPHGPVKISVRTSHENDAPAETGPFGFRYYVQELTFKDRVRVSDLPLGDALAADFNKDGVDDLVLLPGYEGFPPNDPHSIPHVLLQLGQGDGSFGPPTESNIEVPSGYWVSLSEVCDWNNDDFPDLILLSEPQEDIEAPGIVYFLPSQTDGVLGSPTILPIEGFYLQEPEMKGTWTISCGDFDGDDITDLALLGITGVLVSFGDGMEGVREQKNLPLPTNDIEQLHRRWMEVADFDGDHKDDVAVFGVNVYQMEQWLRLLSNLGAGQAVSTEIEIPPVDDPFYSGYRTHFGIIGGDFNNDGFPDLLTIPRPDDIHLLAGDGNRNFQDIPMSSIRDYDKFYWIGHSHRSPSIQTNVAVLVSVSNFKHLPNGITVSFLGSLVDRTEKEYTTFPTRFFKVDGEFPRSILLLRANSDDWTDLLVATQDGAFLFLGGPNEWLHNGEVLLDYQRSIGGLVSAERVGVKIVDLNQDSLADIVGTVKETDGKHKIVSYSNLYGSFDNAREVPLEFLNPGDYVFHYDLAVGDFNNDSSPDVVVWACRNINHSFAVLLGQGDGSFSNPTYIEAGELGFGSLSKRMCDLDGDGNLDMFDPVNLRIARGDGRGFFSPFEQIGFSNVLDPLTHNDRLQIAERSDGECLIVADIDTSETLRFFEFSENQLEEVGEPVERVQGFHLIAIEDFDGDSDPDILATKYYDDFNPYELFIYRGNGRGGMFPPELVSANILEDTHSLFAGDFNGDGLKDLAHISRVADPAFGLMEFTVLVNQGYGRFERKPKQFIDQDPYPNFFLIEAADINGDHLDDIIYFPNYYNTIYYRYTMAFLVKNVSN